jgi:hypothetical protein
MPEQSIRGFPPPWTIERIDGGYVVKDANGQSLAYVYGRENRAAADTAKLLTLDEARRIACRICCYPDTRARKKNEASSARHGTRKAKTGPCSSTKASNLFIGPMMLPPQ